MHDKMVGQQLGGAGEDPTLRVRVTPEAPLWLALIGLGAFWLTREGTLPGQGSRGGAIEALGWGCLYTGLWVAYGSTQAKMRQPLHVLWRRLGLALGLALVSTYVAKVLLGPMLAPAGWSAYYYLRYLLPVVFVALWCAVLLRRETFALARAAASHQPTAPLPQLVLLLASAALAVSFADLAFQDGGESAVEVLLKTQVIEKIPWATNVVILFSALALVFALTRRVAAALVVVLPMYVGLGLATLLKLRYMHAAVQPLDLLRIPELFPFLRGFFGTGAIAAVLAVVALWLGALFAIRARAQSRMSVVRRWSIGVLSLLVLLMFPEEFLRAKHSSHSPLLRLIWGWNRGPGRAWREKARSHGFLLVFLSELPMAFVSTPPTYSSAAVATALRRYPTMGAGAPRSGKRGVNLVVYLAESFMDPDDLGFRYTADPVPNVRMLRRDHTSGHAIVPEEFGGSANTEFELLTGMSVSFLPQWSLPYRQYLRRPIPALPAVLGRLGYATTAIQADPKYFYDREEAYGFLGFDRVIWLNDVPGVERAARGQSPSDQAVVASIIQASRTRRPFFIFAFPTSTHSPYTQGTYKGSALDVEPAGADSTGEVKEYINAMRVADHAIGTLVEYFRGQPDSTIIVVLGDHLPPITARGYRLFFRTLAGKPPAEQARFHRRVPLVVWSNFARPREEVELGTNTLASYLLEEMGMPPAGFLAVSDAVRRRIPVLPTAATADEQGWSLDAVPPAERRLVGDYRLLQYDLLVGKQYSLEQPSAMITAGQAASRP